MIPETLTLSFGDGCTADTFETVFDDMVLHGYYVAINEQDCQLLEWARTEDDRPALRVQPVDDRDEPMGDPIVLALDDIESWHVY